MLTTAGPVGRAGPMAYRMVRSLAGEEQRPSVNRNRPTTKHATTTSLWGAGIAPWLQRRTPSRVRIPAGAAGEFSSPGSTFCADSYFGIPSTPVLPQ